MRDLTEDEKLKIDTDLADELGHVMHDIARDLGIDPEAIEWTEEEQARIVAEHDRRRRPFFTSLVLRG